MIHFELLRDRGILVLEPRGALTAGDFSALAASVDPWIEEHGDLRGLVIEAPSFPGWDDFAALVSHLRFVRDHHRRVRRVAVVSDSKVLNLAPKIAAHFVNAEIRAFHAGEREAALAWIQGAHDESRMTVSELAPGLWRWTAPHPEWTPEKDKPGGWGRMVAAISSEPAEGEAGPWTLIDPIVPPSGTPEESRFWTALDRDLERTGRPLRIVVANGYHARSASEFPRRYGAGRAVEILAHSGAAARLGFEPTGRFTDDTVLPDGIELLPIEALDAGETAVFLRRHRALVFADAVLGAGGGRLAVAPRSWAAEGDAAGALYARRFRPSIERLLGRDPVMVLPSHGEPVLVSGRAALAAALAGPAWGESGAERTSE